MVQILKDKDKPKNKGGRPSKKTPELVKSILDLVAYDGLSLIKACKINGISSGNFIDWTLSDKEVYEHYIKAMNIRNLNMAQEIIEIADDITEDAIIDENGNRKCNNEWINRSRLRIETRKWLLSKLLPKVYGDKLEVDNKGEIKGEIKHTGNIVLEILPVTVNKD